MFCLLFLNITGLAWLIFLEAEVADTSAVTVGSEYPSKDCTEKKQSCAFILPFASREPIFAFVFDEALFALAYATPPFVFELLYDRLTTRGLENSAKTGGNPIRA